MPTRKSDRKTTILVPVPKPVNRTPIPPVSRHRDEKNDYVRTPKHKKPIDETE